MPGAGYTHSDGRHTSLPNRFLLGLNHTDGLEGLVSKRRDSTYRPGRSSSWIKVKNRSHPAPLRVKKAFASSSARPDD